VILLWFTVVTQLITAGRYHILCDRTSMYQQVFGKYVSETLF